MSRWVEISFDCLPLRAVARLDIPLDASPKYRARCERVKQALEQHGSFNTYFLYNSQCTFHLTNHDEIGTIQFRFEGTVFTDSTDQKTERSDLSVELEKETCDWLTEPVVQWFTQAVRFAVHVEFDRYIAAGDLDRAKQRLTELQAKADQQGGYVGMFL